MTLREARAGAALSRPSGTARRWCRALPRGTLPPVRCREDLHLAEPRVARPLHGAADPPEVGDPVAHHAAVEQHVGGVGEPVAEMVAGDPVAAEAAELRPEAEVPPDVVDVDGHADDRVADALADVDRVAHRHEAGAVAAIDRVQRFERELHADGFRVRDRLGDDLGDGGEARGHRVAVLDHPAGDDGQAAGAEGGGVVDGGVEVVAHRARRGVRQRSDQERRPAEADHLKPGGAGAVADRRGAAAQLAPPEHDPAVAALGAGVDHPLGRPARARALDVVAEGRGVERQRRMVGGEVAHLRARRAPAAASCAPPRDRDRARGRRRRPCGSSRRNRAAAASPGRRRA